MNELLTNLYTESTAPLLSAFLLGLLTAISPCPLATNITAIGYMGRTIKEKKKVFISGLIYTLGGVIAYTSLAGLFFIGGTKLHISGFFQQYGETIIGPFLVFIGILMLGLIRINFPAFHHFGEQFRQKLQHSFLDVFILGFIFALAFCPYTGVIYFGMLIPLALSSHLGITVPIVFAIGTAIPVVLFSWLVSYSIGSLSSVFNKTKQVEAWFRRVVAIIFISIGIYYTSAVLI